jgi:hypothetical protein
MKKTSAQLTGREQAHHRYVRAALAEARAKGREFVSGAIAIEITPATPARSTRSMTTRRLSADPNAPTRYPLPPDVPKAIAAITKALVLPDDADANTIATALAALLDAQANDPTTPENIELSGRRLGLSAREITMLKQMKVDPRKYAANKAQRGGGYKPRPQR